MVELRSLMVKFAFAWLTNMFPIIEAY